MWIFKYQAIHLVIRHSFCLNQNILDYANGMPLALDFQDI